MAESRILVIHERIPLPDVFEFDKRLLGFMAELREDGHSVSFVGVTGRGAIGKYMEPLRALGVPATTLDGDSGLATILTASQFDVAFVAVSSSKTVLSVAARMKKLRALCPHTRVGALLDEALAADANYDKADAIVTINGPAGEAVTKVLLSERKLPVAPSGLERLLQAKTELAVLSCVLALTLVLVPLSFKVLSVLVFATTVLLIFTGAFTDTATPYHKDHVAFKFPSTRQVAKPIRIVLHTQTLDDPSGHVAGSEITTFCLSQAFEQRSDVASVHRVTPGTYDLLEELEVDFVLVEGWSEGVPKFLRMVNGLHPNALVFLWNLDTWGWEHLERLPFDGYFTNSARRVQLLRDSGTPTELVMLSADPKVFAPVKVNPAYEHNVVFLGHDSKGKPFLHEALRTAAPFGLGLYGFGWEKTEFSKDYKGALPMGHIDQLYSSAKVVLGLTDQGQVDWGMINNRVFEALACGACFVVQWFPELEAKFGDQLLYYTDANSLRKHLTTLLSNGEESARALEQCRNRGRTFVAHMHTYDHRVEQMVRLYTDLQARSSEVKVPVPPFQTSLSSPHQDPLNDFSQVAGVSDFVFFDSSNMEYLGGDDSRAVRLKCKDQWIMYRLALPAGDGKVMAGSVVTWHWEGAEPAEFTFAWANSSGAHTRVLEESFAPLAAERSQSAPGWTKVVYTFNVPSSEEQSVLIKIMFDNQCEQTWTPQIGEVAFEWQA